MEEFTHARVMGGGALNKRTKAEIACVPTWVDCALGTASGFVSACSAAPFILTVDRAVTENSAGKSPLGAALMRGLRQVFTRPHVMLTSLPCKFPETPTFWLNHARL